MGLGAKLNFAFMAIIFVMSLIQAGFAIYIDYSKSIDKAKSVLGQALSCANQEILNIYRKNMEIAQVIEQDSNFRQAFQAKDKTACAQAIKTIFDRYGFSGYGTIVLDRGQVFYSSDTPNKSGYITDYVNKPIVSMVLTSGRNGSCLCAISDTGTQGLASMVPIRLASPIPGIIVVSQPFGPELLQGIERKIKLSNDNLKDFEMAFYVANPGTAVGRIVACSPAIQNIRPAFLYSLNRDGIKAIGDGKEMEADHRLWRPFPVIGPDGQGAMGLVYVCSLIQGTNSLLVLIGIQIAISAGSAFLLSFLFTAGISSRFDSAMKFLKQRAKDLAANRQDLASLGSLPSEWLELAEMVDTAVTSPRASVVHLRQQVNRKEEELAEKQRQIDAINHQLESVNRQITAQNRQSLEVNNLIQSANQQAIQLHQILQGVLQVSTEGYLLLDPYGSVLSANPAFLNWIGVAEREIAGRLCFDLVQKPGESPNLANASYATPGANPGDLINNFYPEGLVYNRSNNKILEVICHLQPVVVDDSVIVSWIMVLRDKQVHSEANRLRNEIVSMLNQDIRAPLTFAENKWSNLLATQFQGAAPSVVQSLIELHQTYKQMLGVADSYLMMYGGFVPAEIVQREPVSIQRLIGECLEQVSPQSRARGILLDYKTVTGLPNTAVNKELVQEIIFQLLQKMIFVTAPGGRVRVETSIKNKEIRMIITSSGPALGQDDIEDMFLGYIDGKHQEDSYQSRLALYLARNNTERIGGHLWAESEAGRGTAIFFTIPVH